MRLRLCLFAAVLLSTVEFPALCAEAADAPRAALPVVPAVAAVRLEKLETSPLWFEGERGKVTLHLINNGAAPRRCTILLRAQDDGRRS
jgi:hypothetical protein